MQCDVHRNADDETGQIPWLVDVQSNLLSDLETRVVIPLIRTETFGRRARWLHPAFKVEDQNVVLATHLVTAIRRNALGSPITSLDGQRDAILRAIDILWSGV
jgi:toxin CcdB